MEISRVSQALLSINISEVKRQSPAPSGGSEPVRKPKPESDAVMVHLSNGGRMRRAKRNFDSIDSDQDGQLTEDELEVAQQNRQAAGYKTPFIDKLLEDFSSIDKDNSGGVSFAEAHPKGMSQQQNPRKVDVTA